MTCTPSESASFQSYQADCFTPKRGLCRSFSPAAQHCTDSENDPLHTLSDNDSVTCTPSKSEPVTAFNVGRGVLREVQDVCFTPKRSLQRSPPATSEQKSSTNACDRDIKMASPPTKWEIPRTPIETQALSTSVQFQVQPCPNLNKSTRRRMKTPTHPLSQSARAESSLGEVAVTTSTASLPVTGVWSPTITEFIFVCAATLSPGVSKLPGLQYTDNNLAYLEHMKKIKELTELKVRKIYTGTWFYSVCSSSGKCWWAQQNPTYCFRRERARVQEDPWLQDSWAEAEHWKDNTGSKVNDNSSEIPAWLLLIITQRDMQTKWQAISTEYQIAQVSRIYNTVHVH